MTIDLETEGAFKPLEGRAEAVFSHDDARRALEKLFHNMCAYCELQITGGFFWHVEHFRPKGNVKEVGGHGGYYWLACTWENLYPACQFCNIATKDRGTFDHPEPGVTAGKLDQFPLRSETHRMTSSSDSFDEEEEDRLLLDPCRDDPETELGFDGKGVAVALGGSDRAEKSIEVLHLNRSDRVQARATTIQHIISDLGANAKFAVGKVEWPLFRDTILELYGAADRMYAGIARSMKRDPAAFGLLTPP